MTTLFLSWVALAAMLSMVNWRAGVAFWVLAAVLQDPIRKITPDTPAYLTMSFVPIYMAAFLGLCSRTRALSEFKRKYPQLTVPAMFVLVCLACSFVQAVSYGIAFVPAAALGVFSYAGGLPALLIGFNYIRRDPQELDRLFIGFVLLTAVMMVGTVLEYSGVKFSVPLLGTIARNWDWLRWYTNEKYIVMVSGFYRSPEIMGWHAMSMVIFCLYLMVRRSSLAWLWLSGAAFGLFGVVVSGRRKMFLMILVYVATFLLTSGRWRRGQLLRYVTLGCIVTIPLLMLLVQDNYMMMFKSGLASSGKSVASKGVYGILWVAPLVGPFGYGVGTITQGAQHFRMRTEIPLVEGGLEKILVELGILGFAAVFILGFMVARVAIISLRVARRARIDMAAPAAVFAIILANLSAFVVAFQFFGDPFVLTLIGFFAGVLLSISRWAPRDAPPRRGPVAVPSSPLRAPPGSGRSTTIRNEFFNAPTRQLPVLPSSGDSAPAESAEND